jgi:hypothetical protein
MNEELLKQAFVLGVIRASRDAGLEKTAVPNFLKYIGNARNKGQGVLGKALSAGRMGTYGGGPWHDALVASVPKGAKSYLRDTLFGAGTGGAMNALAGGEDPWYERYARGALGGAAGGLAFRGSIEGTRGLMGVASRRKWLGSHAPDFAKRLGSFAKQDKAHSTLGGIMQYAKSGPGTMGESAKRFGMYAAGGVPLAAAGFIGGAKGEGAASSLLGGGVSPEAQAAGVAAPAVASAYRQFPTARYAY